MINCKRNYIVYMLFVLFSILITACSGTSTQSSESQTSLDEFMGSSTKKESKTKVVNTIHGDIEIPANPQRVIVDGYLPTLLLLGVKPVGTTDSDLINVHIQNLISGIDSIGDNSEEKMLDLAPDLIISASAAEKGAEAWLSDFDVKIEQARKKVKAAVGENETVSIIGAFGKDFYIYGDGIYRGGQAIYRHLQLTPPALIQKEMMDQGETYKQVSFEVLADYAGDYIFLDESNGGALNKKDPIWSSITAVKNDRVFYLDAKRYWPYDPIAVLAQAEEVADMLVSKAKNK
ncbi:ABC transporter substrate-binding protein [Paenibacillus sp. OSY-SE]|uniref:ABC transporter substrate-binding protein n=1 Tax=Paenibacillus sp. OSY-SE TaxID=1196323 RepID=UPI000379B6ED|nr:ABC transporter substrate-binding protein [Paenibacillus sp. OSY-SE]